MNVEEYISERIEKQINWYDKKSISCQKKYKYYSIVSIISTSSIPIILLFSDFNEFGVKVVVALLGSISSILGSLLTLNNYQGLWIKYRNTCELLNRELYLFKTSSGKYFACTNSTENFISNCENIMSFEHDYWFEVSSSSSSSTNS